MNVNAEMMPFKKYVQSKGIIYDENTIRINGTFKEKNSGKIIKRDIITAHKLGKLSIKDIYKTYLAWFNLTRTEDEDERTFVNVFALNNKKL